MEFGSVTPEELEEINFTLPPGQRETTTLLSKSNNKNLPQVFVGCAKWGSKDWIGKVYPKGTKGSPVFELTTTTMTHAA